MKSIKLYENVVIGNFLYALGSAIRAKSKSDVNVSCINLLQQTPADQELADVLLEFPGVVRLIEFKQLSNKSKKESRRVRNLNEAIAEKINLLTISKTIHWFVETNPEKNTFVSRIVPYIDAYSNSQSKYDLDQFIEEIADNAVHGREQFSRKELQEYLDFVQITLGEGEVGTGGLIFAVDEVGNLRFLELIDMNELGLQHRELLEKKKQEFKQRLNLAPSHEEGLNQKRILRRML
jgi:hypothetical protein